MWQSETVREIKDNPDFLKEIPKDSLQKFDNLFQDSESIRTMAVLTNLRLVVSIARKYSWLNVLLLDRVQAGNIGLMKAVEKYDYTREVQFSTMATPWISQEITREHLGKSTEIAVPYNTFHAYMNAKKILSSYAIIPQIAELQDILRKNGIPEKEINLVIPLLNGTVDTFNFFFLGEPIALNGEISETLTYADVIFDATVSSIERTGIARINWETLLHPLIPKQQNTLIEKYIAGLSNFEIAKKRGRDSETIRLELIKIFDILKKHPLVLAFQEESAALNKEIKILSQEEYIRKNILYLANQGIPVSEIADRFYVTEETVNKIIGKKNIKTKKND